jgi:hypothetical protein
MPSVKVRTTRNSENGGRWRASFRAAKVTDNMMYGAIILNTWRNPLLAR